MEKSPWAPLGALFLASLLWGGAVPALKAGVMVYHPIYILFGRLFIGSLCFILVYKRIIRVRPRRADWPALLAMVLCEPCLFSALEIWGITKTTASQAGMILSLFPLLVLIAARFFLQERIPGRAAAGFGLAVAGACWLSTVGAASANAPSPIQGNALVALSLVFAAACTILFKKLAVRYPPLFLSALQACGGALFFFPALVLVPDVIPDRLDIRPLLTILYLGAVTNFGAYSLYNFGISRIPAGRAAAFINLIPVFSLVSCRLFLGEILETSQYLASGVILAGLLLSQGGPSRSKTTGETGG
ncbi:MAG: DMT family transporter [Pseudomonadota bacterium]